jgi:hypothetical protein
MCIIRISVVRMTIHFFDIFWVHISIIIDTYEDDDSSVMREVTHFFCIRTLSIWEVVVKA